MPKGALLHAHLDATVSASTLLSLASSHPAMHVRASRRITPTTIKSTTPQFRALPAERFNTTGSLTAEGYEGETWVELRVARESFGEEVGGKAGFDKWACAALTINPTEAYETHNTVYKVWLQVLLFPRTDEKVLLIDFAV